MKWTGKLASTKAMENDLFQTCPSEHQISAKGILTLMLWHFGVSEPFMGCLCFVIVRPEETVNSYTTSLSVIV
jgi:hypothetical protein